MTVEETNVAILTKAYTGWHETKGDPSVWDDVLGNVIAFGSLADGRPGMEFTKPRASKAEVREYLQELVNDWSMESFHMNEYVAQGERVVALGEMSWTHRRTNKTITIPKVDVWLFENGKAVQFMEHFDTYTALMACQD